MENRWSPGRSPLERAQREPVRHRSQGQGNDGVRDHVEVRPDDGVRRKFAHQSTIEHVEEAEDCECHGGHDLSPQMKGC